MSGALSRNVVDDFQLILSYRFMVNALRAGTIVAVVSGAIGYFMVLRRRSLRRSHLGRDRFPGAAGAAWLGLNADFGYFGFCLLGALVIAAIPTRSGAGRTSGLGGYGEESAAIGTVQAFALACGFLFVSLYRGFLSDLNSLLFGTIIGVTDTQVVVLLVAGAVCLFALAVIGRPLLFATVDPDVAAARGLRVRLLSLVFLLLLGNRRGGHEPGDRQSAGLRAAGRSRGHRHPAHGPTRAGVGAVDRHRAAGHLAGGGHRVLLAVPDRLLGDDAGIRSFPAGDGVPRAGRPAGPPPESVTA